jgi:CubicO group peptidase (beta-lactamase class C family)
MPHTNVIDTVIQGDCDPRFTAVREALERNFADRGEIGSAVAIYYRGEKVVDLWDGHMDAARTRPWRAETLCLMYSIAKSMCARCVHILAEDVDAMGVWPGTRAGGILTAHPAPLSPTAGRDLARKERS